MTHMVERTDSNMNLLQSLTPKSRKEIPKIKFTAASQNKNGS